MNIVAVDDEELALEYLIRIVEEAQPGSKVTGFLEPGAALAHVKEEATDVAFLDVEMYGMNGIELARSFKEVCPGINIIFVTGYSSYAMEAFSVHASGYLLKPPSLSAVRKEMENLRMAVPPSGRKRVRVQTFGNFEVFVDGRPLLFHRTKAKELLAYLIDRKGAGANTSELISVLWRDKEYSISLQRQFQTVVSDLLKTLKNAAVADILIKKRNHISVDTEQVDCDYYAFLNGDAQAINSYLGEYMANYTWAEFTTGFLCRKVADAY